ncbi:MAG: hypothetical protein J7L07_02095 [Candidatus Odinarchaeota archaeon]|nr:hypothetical protein [Candidatus Odinarchaeota archaeon]
MTRKFWIKNYRFVIEDGKLTIYDLRNNIVDSYTGIDKLDDDELALLIFGFLRDKGVPDFLPDQVKKILKKEVEVEEELKEKVVEEKEVVVKKPLKEYSMEWYYAILFFTPMEKDFLVKMMDFLINENRDLIEASEIVKKRDFSEGAFLCKNGVVNKIRIISSNVQNIAKLRELLAATDEIIFIVDAESSHDMVYRVIDGVTYRARKVSIISIGWHPAIDNFRKKFLRSGYEYGYRIVTSINEAQQIVVNKISKRLCGKRRPAVIIL